MRQKDFQGKVVTATIPNTAIALVLLLLKQEVFADQGVGLWCDDAFVHFGFFFDPFPFMFYIQNIFKTDAYSIFFRFKKSIQLLVLL